MKTLVLTGVADGKKIQAIKTFRAASGWGLKESRDVIDSLDTKGIHKVDETDEYPSLKVTPEMIGVLRRGGIACHIEDSTSHLTVWMIWVQAADDNHVWLEAAWEDDMSAENHGGWTHEVARVKSLCADNNYEMRIQKVSVPGVLELFQIPTAEAGAA